MSHGTAGTPSATDPGVGKFRQPTGLAVDGGGLDRRPGRARGNGWGTFGVNSPTAVVGENNTAITGDEDTATVLVASLGAEQVNRHDAATGDRVAATLAGPATVALYDDAVVVLDAAAWRPPTAHCGS